MKIPPNYELNSELIGLVKKIDSLRRYFRSLHLSPQVKAKIEKSNILKSAIFSARLSGNPLKNYDFLKEKNQFLPPRQEEILNIIRVSHMM